MRKKPFIAASFGLFLQIFLLLGISSALGQTPMPTDIIRNTFEEFRKQVPEMSSPDAREITSVRYPTFWLCSDGFTTLSIDFTGNVSYKRVHGWTGPEVSDLESPTNHFDASTNNNADDAALIQRTWQLARAWMDDKQLVSFESIVKHESILMALVPDGQPYQANGRTLVRISRPTIKIYNDNHQSSFFQAVFDPSGSLLRIDIRRFEHSHAMPTAKGAFDGPFPLPPKMPGGDQPMKIGCFFSPSEARFESMCLGAEGVPYFDVYQPSPNPFPDPATVKIKSKEEERYYRSWFWWRCNGCVGAFRGNWIVKDGQSYWDRPNDIIFHQSLDSYKPLSGKSAGTSYVYAETMEPKFYDDLERCTVALFATHGGLLGSKEFELGRDKTNWFNFMPPSSKLGDGELRHIFLSDCGAFYDKALP